MASPYKTNFGNIEIFAATMYFAKIMTRNPGKIGNLTNITELYPFLEAKKWYLRGFYGHDLLVKTTNSVQVYHATLPEQYVVNRENPD